MIFVEFSGDNRVGSYLLSHNYCPWAQAPLTFLPSTLLFVVGFSQLLSRVGRNRKDLIFPSTELPGEHLLIAAGSVTFN